MAIHIKSVLPGSPAEQAGIRPGDLLLSVDGNQMNDTLDYQYYTAAIRFQAQVKREEETLSLPVRKQNEYQPFGCDFDSYLGDEKRSCANHCMFCFIDQLPEGMRESLYFKDDDDRLSFLFGNYITLTNLDDAEVERIIKMRISPINISVHTTNPELRIRMMANRRAGETLKYLYRFVEAGIQVNCQLVLCRGVNDGVELRHTLDDLLEIGDQIGSIAAVPAGLTRYRKHLYPLLAYDAETAGEVIDILEEYGDRCLKNLGSRLIYPSDEWYIKAGRSLPDMDFYEEFPQLENGVGMWRLFREEFLEELCGGHGLIRPHKMDLVTGELAAPLLQEMADALHRRYPQVEVTIHPIRNDFFGGNVNVAGLVTGTDILAQCRGKLQSKVLGVPEVMIRTEGDMFLDDVTLEQVGRELGVRVRLLPSGGGENCRAILGLKIGTR